MLGFIGVLAVTLILLQVTGLLVIATDRAQRRRVAAMSKSLLGLTFWPFATAYLWASDRLADAGWFFHRGTPTREHAIPALRDGDQWTQHATRVPFLHRGAWYRAARVARWYAIGRPGGPGLTIGRAKVVPAT